MMFGPQRLGLGIGRDRISAVLIVRGSIRWAAWAPRQPDTSLADAIASLLAACPRRRVYPLGAIAALGPTVSQLKCLTDLPPIGAASAIVALVRENTGRFFLRNGVPLLVSGAHIESASRVWIAAVDAPVVADVAAGCRRAGITLQAIVPSAVALRHAIRDRSITWIDGDVRLDIAYGDNAPTSVRRAPANGAALGVPRLVSTLSEFGEPARDAIDAAGAALTPRNEPVVVRAADATPRAVPSRRRLARAAAACVVAIAAALVLPGVVASFAARRDAAAQARIESRASASRSDANALAQTTAALRALADFSNSRQSMVLLLAEITRSLPDSSSLVAFQVDSTGLGSVVAVSPHAAAVVDAVERTPGLASPQIVGPVTRERVGGRTLERVSVRFQLIARSAR
jgi:type II secretory pathway pseudopilin PulG